MMVLRYIAEDVFQYSTPVTVSRRDDLRNSLIAITSRAPAVMDEATPTKLVPVEVYRACGVAPGNEGWLARVTASLFSNVEAYAVGSNKVLWTSTPV